MDCSDVVFRNQLRGGPTQGEDCGVVSTAMALDFITCGQVDKDVRQIRSAMGVRTGPTRTVEQEAALRKFALSPERLRTIGERKHRPPKVQRRVLVPFEEAREALEAGKALVISIGYRVVNGRRPGLSGDRGFQGCHSIFAAAIRDEPKGGRSWLIYDPLYNVPGEPRRPVPTGPQWWPEWLMRRAAARMNVLMGHDAQGQEIRGEVGPGRIVFVAVTRPRPRRPDAPDTDDEENDDARAPRGSVDEGPRPATDGDDAAEELVRARAQVSRLRARIADLEAENEAAEERLEELETAMGDVAAVLAAVTEGAGAESET